MEEKKTNNTNKSDNVLYISEKEEQKYFEDSVLCNLESDTKECNHIQDLTELEKINLSQVIERYKKSIISWWLKHDEMKTFYVKFDLEKDDIKTYISYF